MGTLVGAGGGFILVPALLIFYPALGTETITAISLVIVCCNAISGSIAYAYKKNIDYRSAFIFSLAAAPGSILGAFATTLIARKNFEAGFGALMILIAGYLLLGKKKPRLETHTTSKYPSRILVDRAGKQHVISYNVKLGTIFSGFVGFFSSLLGIGGGIIHVPILVRILRFPVHIATATSHLILAITAFIGVTTHYLNGDMASVGDKIIWLAPSVVLGAQLGAHLSSKVNELWILRILAIGLISVGVRFIVMS